MNYTKKRIAQQLYKIKHWKIQNGTYEDIPKQKATHFLDAPYQFGGHAYKCSNKKIDFNHLGNHCKSLPGQVIVCENSKATWLPFVPLISQQVLTGRHDEVIWTNTHTHFNNLQYKLFNNDETT